ncbi:unnamed protein product [Darwinula stevensoni]|uniref:Uncharacterized protein n=1 Tax=Darwinula stevensoni TaxID=69355 RepID=A0A7R8X9H6_9CRUS|nr:unnamed protein product [Darwinula stevensoni]CAG0882559.1 unnamed protein product [Darwinula stevensoni]
MEGGMLVFLTMVAGCLVGVSLSQDCGGTLTAPYGEIMSPGYPDSYPPNTNCQWIIEAPTDTKILLVFYDFHLEYTVGCFPGDFLTVSDPVVDPQIFCGDNPPCLVESTGNSLSISFFSNSDDDQEGYRFHLAYITISSSSSSRCEEGWEEFGSYCYFFSEEEMEFEEAQMDCEARNANLTSIHSKEEQLFVKGHSKTPTVWIGAIKTGSLLDDPFDFEFVDGTPSDYHKMWSWPSTLLDGCSGSNFCMIQLVPDRWENRDCLETRPVICNAAMGHGPDWACYDAPKYKGCFHVSTEAYTYEAGRSYCQSFPGADIVHIVGAHNHTLLAQAFQYPHYFPHPLPKWNEFWIGLRLDLSGDWTWVNGSPFYVDRWEVGYPVVDGGDCVVMTTSSWDDIPRDNPGSYVCKKSF